MSALPRWVRCINCRRSPNVSGRIEHARTCPDYPLNAREARVPGRSATRVRAVDVLRSAARRG